MKWNIIKHSRMILSEVAGGVDLDSFKGGRKLEASRQQFVIANSNRYTFIFYIFAMLCCNG